MKQFDKVISILYLESAQNDKELRIVLTQPVVYCIEARNPEPEI